MNAVERRDAWEVARREWPGLDVPRSAFEERLDDVLRKSGRDDVEGLDVAALYLVAGCLERQPAALELLERRHLSRLPAALSRFAAQGLAVDDVVQEIRARLLGLGRTGGPPRLASYTGRGDLDRWLGAVAMRAAIDARRSGGRTVVLSEGAVERLAASGGLELSLIKAELRAPFREAVQRAVQALPDRERRVLELHYLHGLTTARIGALYDSHRITVTRWLVSARQRILAEVESHLGQEAGITPSQVGSMWRLFRSSLDASLPRLLAGTAEDTLE